MFKWLRKDPIAKLEKEYDQLLEKALNLQRNGDILGFAQMTGQAEELATKIEEMKANKS